MIAICALNLAQIVSSESRFNPITAALVCGTFAASVINLPRMAASRINSSGWKTPAQA